MTTRALAQVQREQEFTRTAEAVNKFIISTVQFLNRFAAHCDSKLLETSRSLQRLEALTVLLETKINSVDEEFDETNTTTNIASTLPNSNISGNNNINNNQLTIVDSNFTPPPIPGFTSAPHRHIPPPPPPASSSLSLLSSNQNNYLQNSKKNRNGPPLPPGVKLSPDSHAVGTNLTIMAPTNNMNSSSLPVPQIFSNPTVMTGHLPEGFIPPPPPPMPLLGGFTMQTHPRLMGYFQMLSLRVPVEAIKAKMQADGYQPEWLDTPDAPAPPSLSSVNNILYDSD